jgi:prevent-host-death family protein
MVILVIMNEAIMVSEVSAVNFRQNLGEMLNQVQYQNDSIVVSKDGKPVAALVGADLFARIRAMQDRFDQLSSRVAEAYVDVPADMGMAEIDAAIAQEWRG